MSEHEQERPEWLTLKQVAAQLQVSEVTVRRWLHTGQLAGVRLPGTRAGWRIHRQALERFLAERALATTSADETDER
jgi:excisionase family DNA binding protein